MTDYCKRFLSVIGLVISVFLALDCQRKAKGGGGLSEAEIEALAVRKNKQTPTTQHPSDVKGCYRSIERVSKRTGTGPSGMWIDARYVMASCVTASIQKKAIQKFYSERLKVFSKIGAFFFLTKYRNTWRKNPTAWIASITKVPADSTPVYTVRVQKQYKQKSPTTISKGASEQSRRAFYREFWMAEQRAQRKAMERYPDDINRSLDYQERIFDQYYQALLKKYRIRDKDLDKILFEGQSKGWPRQ